MNKHDTDVLSLTFGSVFLAVVVWWLVARWVSVDLPTGGWLVAGGLILLGLLGLYATVRPHGS